MCEIHSSGSEFFLNRIAKATKTLGETKRFGFFVRHCLSSQTMETLSKSGVKI